MLYSLGAASVQKRKNPCAVALSAGALTDSTVESAARIPRLCGRLWLGQTTGVAQHGISKYSGSTEMRKG